MSENYIDFVSEKVLDEHNCNECQKHADLMILHIISEESSTDGWVLSIVNRAKERDVVDGEADCLGEVLYGTTISITYCPFCGQQL